MPLTLTPEQGGYVLRYASAPVKRPEMGEVGGAGTTAYSGFLKDEYLSELQGQKACELYDRMRRSDAQVRMTLRAVTLPILQATWRCVPSEDDPEKGEEIAAFVERVLLRGMTTTWLQTLKAALLMLTFGFSPLEKVWELRSWPEALKGTGAPEKVVWLRKLAPRLPKSVWKWEGLDTPDASLTAVTQQLRMGGFEHRTIPIEKLVIFVNDKEGDNWEGISLLRSAYKHWWIKEHLEKIDAAGHERMAMGVPVAKIDESAGYVPDSDKGKALLAALEDILSNIQANERAYIVETPGVTFRFEVPSVNSNAAALLSSVDYHNRMISVNILGQFLELGNTQSGSRAVATEQRGPFDLQLLAIAQEIGETMEQFVVRELVDYNYGPRPGYPALQAHDLLSSNQEPMARILANLIKAGAIIPDQALEDWTRETLELPAADTATSRQAPAPVSTTVATLAARRAHRHYAGEPGAFWRDPTYAERFVAFAQIDRDLAQAKTEFVAHVGETAHEMSAGLVTMAAAAVRAQEPDHILTLKAPKVGKVASRIRGELPAIVAYGRAAVRGEKTRAQAGQPAATLISPREQGIKGYAGLASEDGGAAFLGAKADAAALQIASRAELATQAKAMALIKRLALGALFEAEIERELEEVVTKAVETAVLDAGGRMVAESFGLGRAIQIATEVQAGGVTKGIYSALLDGAVCDECAPLDGQEFEPGSADFDKYASGNPDCLGGDRCRCMLFLEYEGMEQPEVEDWQPGDNPDVVMPGFNPIGQTHRAPQA